MMSSRIKTLICTGCLVCLLLAGCGKSARQAETPAEPQAAARAIDSSQGGTAGREYRVLHVMSYHSPWEWTDDLLRGFQDALAGLQVEYEIFQMDTKRNSTPEWKLAIGEKARNLIETWQPDLVYTTDDNAQEYIARYYINKDLPFVFSAVNVDPAEYDFVGSSNITGVLEQEHFVETVALLKEIVPSVVRIAVIVDDDPTWVGVVARMKAKAATLLTDIKFVSWDTVTTFEEYRRKVGEYQNKADALALLGVHTFKGENGRNITWQEVLRWTAENSMLPDFSFWNDRVSYGTLCVVAVSGYEQGLAAGKIARGILAEGKSPSSYPMKPTIKGQPIISLARARKLGISVKSNVLLTVKVVERFAWEE